MSMKVDYCNADRSGRSTRIHDVLESTANPDDALAKTLSILFEPSPILFSTLVPQLASHLASSSKDAAIVTYRDIIHSTLALIGKWDDDLRSQFIVGHPRIGENKDLSNLSAKEQGAGVTGVPTASSEILARLKHLNACYEQRYPRLRYITFVNGRSRAAVAEEMENRLGIEHSLSPIEPQVDVFEPLRPKDVAWRAELDRAIFDIGQIAENRLRTLGAE